MGSGKADAHSIRIPAQKLQVTVFDNRAVSLQLVALVLLQTQTALCGVVSVRHSSAAKTVLPLQQSTRP